MTDTRTPAEVVAHRWLEAVNLALFKYDQNDPAYGVREVAAELDRKRLAALAESPDVVERMARAMDGAHVAGPPRCSCSDSETDFECNELRESMATAALAALTGDDR